MNCPNCGRENRDVAQFCQFCGMVLREAVPESDLHHDELEDTVFAPPDLEDRMPLQDETAIAVPDAETEPLQTGADPHKAALPPEDTHTPVEEAAPMDQYGELTSDEVPSVEEPPDTVAQAPLRLDGVSGQWGDDGQESEPELTPDAETVIDAGPQGEAALPAVETEAEPPAAVASAGGEEPIEDEGPAEAAFEEAHAEAAFEEAHAEAEAAFEEARTEADELDEEDLFAEPLAQEEEEEALVSLEDDLLEEGEAAEAVVSLEDEDLVQEDEAPDIDLLPWSDEVSPLTLLDPGTVVANRYRVVEVLSDEGNEVLYRVRDLWRCPKCSSTENSPDQAFCTSCGATLDDKPLATMLARPLAHSGDPVEAEVEDQFQEEVAYWVWRETTRETGPLGGAEVPLRLVLGQASDTGQVRELDEDSLFVLVMSRTHESVEDTMALLVVADGMGGHEGGEIASKVAIQTLADVLLRNVFMAWMAGNALSEGMLCDWLRRSVQEANEEVFLERQKRQNDMGTTMTAALLKDWMLCIAHVGDCRAYRWCEDGLEQLTTDHSIVASMVASGAAQPEEIYTHPQRSVIYRCVGDQPSVEVDVTTLPLNPGDRLVLCCDGLWEMLRDEGIEDVMLSEPDPQRAADVMVDAANLAGGTDNISVIVVQL